MLEERGLRTPGPATHAGAESRVPSVTNLRRGATLIDLHPLVNLVLGICTVIGLIVWLRFNAFLALIIAAMLVSLLAPGEPAERVARVAEAFGSTAGRVGIVIALAAVIGQCLMISGAADRIVHAFLRLLGRPRGNIALASSGFVLSAPVFFDTVFYLLVPLARSMHRVTKVDYLKYILAIGAGGVATHTLVPPTPGPLIMADQLGVAVGMMILVGTVIAVPALIAGLVFGSWAQKRMPIPMRPLGTEEPGPDAEPAAADRLPRLWAALLPILLPVVLISSDTILSTIAGAVAADPTLAERSALVRWLSEPTAVRTAAILGNPNLALLLSAAAAMGLVWQRVRPTRRQFAHLVEEALLSGGLIILITAAGGAFGAMLQVAQVGEAVQNLFAGREQATGILLLLLGFTIASLMKIAQGSGTVAMIAGSAMLAAMIDPSDALPFHPAYLAAAVGCGSMVCSWMNDSGFWIVARLSGLTEIEALKTWTVMLVVMGFTGLAFTMLLASRLPLT